MRSTTEGNFALLRSIFTFYPSSKHGPIGNVRSPVIDDMRIQSVPQHQTIIRMLSVELDPIGTAIAKLKKESGIARGGSSFVFQDCSTTVAAGTVRRSRALGASNWLP
jgi:hypothetical protein